VTTAQRRVMDALGSGARLYLPATGSAFIWQPGSEPLAVARSTALALERGGYLRTPAGRYPIAVFDRAV